MQNIKGREENALFRNEIYTKLHEIPNKNKQFAVFLSAQIWYISFVFRRNHCWNQIPGWVKKAQIAKSFRKEFLKKLEKGHFRMYNMYISEQSFLNLFFSFLYYCCFFIWLKLFFKTSSWTINQSHPEL